MVKESLSYTRQQPLSGKEKQSGEARVWKTPGARNSQCCGSQSGKVLALPFATLSGAPPVKSLLARSTFWHSNNAILEKRGGLPLAGSFCGLAKCMFPDLTQPCSGLSPFL